MGQAGTQISEDSRAIKKAELIRRGEGEREEGVEDDTQTSDLGNGGVILWEKRIQEEVQVGGDSQWAAAFQKL